jgi:hypothetical protein
MVADIGSTQLNSRTYRMIYEQHTTTLVAL